MPKNYTIVSARLAASRVDKGMSQMDLIRKLQNEGYNVSSATISTWETGRRKVPLKYLEPLSSVLGVSTTYLVGMNNDPNSEVSTDDEDTNEISKIQIPYEHLYKFHNKPIFVEYKNHIHESSWGIYDKERSQIVFKDYIIPVDTEAKKLCEFYAYAPYETDYTGITKKQLDYATMKMQENVFVKMNTTDKLIKGQYDGWYHHNENRTALINNNGLVLPYEGIGVSYTVYSSGKNDE